MDTLQDVLDDKGHEVHAITPRATVLEAVEAMCRARVGSLLVMRDETLLGIVSERDLTVMTREVLCVEPDLSPRDAMAIMTEHRVRHLPVGSHGRVVGLVSIGDLVRCMLREREHTIAYLEAYVEGRYPG